MIDYNYNFEVTKNLKIFESCLDDTIIKRYNNVTEEAQDSIKVNYIYGPKSRILQDIKGKPDTVKLPIVAVTTTGFSRDDTRLKNKLDDIIYKNNDGNYVNIKAIPFNIDVSVSILCKYQMDLDQIVQNFAVNSNPYFVYSLREPKSGRELRVEVIWDGKITTQYPTDNDLPPNTPFRIMGNANFVIKTWLFKTELSPVNRICYIYDDIIPSNNFYCDFTTLSTVTVNNEIDHYSLSGKPTLRYIQPYNVKIEETPSIKIQGDGFLNTYAIFVSGNNQMYPNKQDYVPLSAFGDDTIYQGILVEDFIINSSQELTFNLPAPYATGLIDVFAITPCGMGQLTIDSNRINRVENPYSINMPEYYTWQVSQFPFYKGLIVNDQLNNLPEIMCDSNIINIEPNYINKNAIIQAIKNLMILGNINSEDIE